MVATSDVRELAPFFRRCPVCGTSEAEEVARFQTVLFVRCATCRSYYKSHEWLGLRAHLQKAYDSSYFEKGDAQYLRRWAHRVAKCKRQLLMCLEFLPGARTSVDVGCSAGYVLAAASELGLIPTGIDVSDYAVELAQRRGFAAQVATLTSLPFPDGSFDILTAKHTLEHVDDPLGALREIYRVLTPGGVAFIIVPDADYYKLACAPLTSRYFRPEKLGWQHHVYYTAESLRLALISVGFEILSNDKAIYRSRLAGGLSSVWEAFRYAGLKAWTTTSRVTHLRRELQLIARKPA